MKKQKISPVILNDQTYLGNPLLKRAGVQIEWTPETRDEYIRCAESPIYFIENYVKIINIDKGLVPFILYDYQRDIVNSLHENRFSIIATSRQSGKSTTVSAFILWYIIFNSEKTVALLANKEMIAREILSKVQLAYQHLPKWLQQGVVEWNKGSMVLENHSRAIAAATSSSAIRGFTINFLFIDEAAFVEKWEDFYTSVFPTITAGSESKVGLVSTPNGLNHFWQIWDNAQKGKNNYNHIEVPWWRVPMSNGVLRDEEWKNTTLSGLNFDYEKFRQEYEVQFLGSSGTLIAGWKLQQMEGKIPLASQASITQFEKPEKGRFYAICCDVSEGRGLDYSAFHVIDVTEIPYKQVCVYYDNIIAPYDYADVIYRTAKSYNEAYVLIETNGIGAQVADTMFYEFGYEYLFKTENAGRIGKKISNGFGNKPKDRGVKTTKSVKAIGCAILKLLIEQDKLIINDAKTIFELSTFSRQGQSFEAEEGRNDDLVMGLVLFAWLSDQNVFAELTNINTLQALREKDEFTMSADLMPFGFNDGRETRENALEINDVSTGKEWWDTDRNNGFF